MRRKPYLNWKGEDGFEKVCDLLCHLLSFLQNERQSKEYKRFTIKWKPTFIGDNESGL